MILNSFHKSKLLFLHYVQPDIFNKYQQTNLRWGMYDWVGASSVTPSQSAIYEIQMNNSCENFIKKTDLGDGHEDRNDWDQGSFFFETPPVTPPREARSIFSVMLHY